jgi:Rab GDP dissociation inhibitor
MTDIYIAVVSSAHNVCPKGYYIAIVSTIAESDSNHHLELKAGLDRLGAIEEQFLGPPIPLYEPLESGTNDNIFLSKSYDATSHFETTTGENDTPELRQTNANVLQMTSRTSTAVRKARSWLLRV